MMRMRHVHVSGSSAAILVFAALASTAAAGPRATAIVGCEGGPDTYTAVTSSYRFVLHVAMAEKMYTPAQVRKLHPKHGEVMLHGSMVMGGMAMGGSMRHLEVQICSRTTNAVVTNANPTIVVVDNSAKNTTTKVPVAVMEGIEEGVADLHYGNNVTMPARHRFTIIVTLKGERATLRSCGAARTCPRCVRSQVLQSSTCSWNASGEASNS